MKKIINSATKQYVPVDTENLVLDDTPTEGSFNAVTSDGVAKAIAEGGGGTTYTAGDGIAISADNEISANVDGTTIQVNADGKLFANVSGGTTVLGNDVSMNWNSSGNFCYYDFSSDVASKITTGIYLVRFKVIYDTAPGEYSGLGNPAMIQAGIWSRTGGQWGFESQFVLLPSTNGAGTARGFEGTGVFTIDDSSFVPEYFRLQLHTQSGAYISTAPGFKKITVVKIG